MIYLILLLLIILIIINIIISNSKNDENFITEPDKLIYLYNDDTICPNCKIFKDTWDTIENEVKANPFYYKFATLKYNIETDENGILLAKDNKINTSPALIFKSGDKYKIYKDKSSDSTTILEWARTE